MPHPSDSQQLPTELWYHIFRHHPNREHLWLTCRLVCKAWRSEILKVFRKEDLQNPSRTHIAFSFSQWYFRYGRNRPVPLPMIFRFERFEGSDRKRCVFREHPRSANSYHIFRRYPWDLWGPAKVEDERQKREIWIQAVEEWQAGKDRHVERCLQDERNPPSMRRRSAHLYHTPYFIWINTTSRNYIELPGLRHSFEESEISFEWERLYKLVYSKHGGIPPVCEESTDQHDQLNIDGKEKVAEETPALQKDKRFGKIWRRLLRPKPMGQAFVTRKKPGNEG